MSYITISRLPKTLQNAIKALPQVHIVRGKACRIKIDPSATEVAFDSGRSWCYRTCGGTYISHPSAYARRGWSNMVYHAAKPSRVTLPLDFAVRHGYIPEGYFGPLVTLVVAAAFAS